MEVHDAGVEEVHDSCLAVQDADLVLHDEEDPVD